MSKSITVNTFFSMLNSGLFRVENDLQCNNIECVLWCGDRMIATRTNAGDCEFYESGMLCGDNIVIEGVA